MSGNNRGLFSLLWDVLSSPAAAFDSLRAEEKPPFIGAALLFTGISLVFSLLTIPKMQQYYIWMLDHAPGITPEMAAAQRPMMSAVAVVTTILTGLAVPWLYWLVVAGLLKLYDTLFGGKTVTFGALFAVAVYGYLPELLGSVILYLMILAAPVENLLWASVSLAALLPQAKTFFYFFMTHWNPFTWWSLALWGIGWTRFARVDTNKPTIYIVIFGAWLVFSVLTAYYSLGQATNLPG
jgi:hypothetical protein